MEMYSLYRAWLSFAPGLNAPPYPAQFSSPIIGQTPLNLTASAPTSNGSPDVVLQVGPGMTQFSAHKAVLSAHSGYFKGAFTNHTDPDPISVPNVNVDEFSCLLTFMYTGYLDLNIRNIYNILLATHILHMPAALELCRTFLLQPQPPEPRVSVIKPIPSRGKVRIEPHHVYQPDSSSNTLLKHHNTPFRAVNKRTEPDSEEMRAIPSTSRNEDVNNDDAKKPASKKVEQRRNKRRSECEGKAVIDIACCDGPVRFHRVVNKNYGMQDVPRSPTDEDVTTFKNNDAMNKAMNENIKRSTDENKMSGDTFTCLYCNHTFKSQYCYQKHARRHLNPIGFESKAPKEPQVKREVKILDMNVQYYPCKTCGSKFPSYYFVHKHRKMCHAEEMTVGEDGKEIVVNPEEGVSRQSAVSSTIDIEAVHSDNNEDVQN